MRWDFYLSVTSLTLLTAQSFSLLEPIKLELALSDSQLGLLRGLAFALFYTFLGIPIAALADRRSR